jgi:hypothetical protein
MLPNQMARQNNPLGSVLFSSNAVGNYFKIEIFCEKDPYPGELICAIYTPDPRFIP